MGGRETLGYGKLIEEARGLSQKHKSVIQRRLNFFFHSNSAARYTPQQMLTCKTSLTCGGIMPTTHSRATQSHARAGRASMVRGSSIVKELDLGNTRTLATVFQKGSGKAAWGKLDYSSQGNQRCVLLDFV